MSEIPLYIDSTMLAAWRQCETKFRWEFLSRLRPAATSIHLHAGACFATGLETLYKKVWLEHKPLDEALALAEFDFLKAWGDFEARIETPKSRDRMLLAIYDYAATYDPPHDHIRPFETHAGPSPFEFSFALPLDHDTTGLDFPLHPSGSPFIYCGRFDMIGQLDGIPVIRDDKTASFLDAKWSDKWSLRAQFLGYCFAMQKLGFAIDTVVVRGVAIQKTQIKHAEAVKSYPQFLIQRWLEQTRRDLTRLLSAFQLNDFSFDLGESCTAYGGCPYLDLCKSSEPERWFSNFVETTWNPLRRNQLEADAPNA